MVDGTILDLFWASRFSMVAGRRARAEDVKPIILLITIFHRSIAELSFDNSQNIWVLNKELFLVLHSEIETNQFRLCFKKQGL